MTVKLLMFFNYYLWIIDFIFSYLIYIMRIKFVHKLLFKYLFIWGIILLIKYDLLIKWIHTHTYIYINYIYNLIIVNDVFQFPAIIERESTSNIPDLDALWTKYI